MCLQYIYIYIKHSVPKVKIFLINGESVKISEQIIKV